MSNTMRKMLKILEAYGQEHRISLDENTPKEERLAIRRCGPSSWEVFYTEKGSVYDRRVFSNEKEACVYMLQRLLPGFHPEDFLKLL